MNHLRLNSLQIIIDTINQRRDTISPQNTSTPSTLSVTQHTSHSTPALVMLTNQHFCCSLKLSVSDLTSTNFTAYLSSLQRTKSGIPKDHCLKSDANFLKNIAISGPPMQYAIAPTLVGISLWLSQFTSILWQCLCFSYSYKKYCLIQSLLIDSIFASFSSIMPFLCLQKSTS